jgi:hypothetical protein
VVCPSGIERPSGLPHRRIVSPASIPLLIIGAVLAPLVFRTQADPDLWGHVRFGLDLLASHTLARIDQYSFTQDIPWVNHEWLSELFMGGAYQLGGGVGLSLIKGALVLVTMVVVLSAYRHSRPLVQALVFLALAVGTGRVTGSLRPQLWSLLGVAILCRTLIAGPRRWWLLAFPIMFGLWVNFHGGWIVGAAILAIWTVARAWRDESARTSAVTVAALSALSTLINPYGWRMWQFLADTIPVSRPIVEWQPLLTTPVTAWIPWFVAALAIALTPFATKRPPLDRLATVVVLGVASFRVERLSAFFIVATLILLSPTIKAQWPATSERLTDVSRRSAIILGTACVVLVLVSATLTARAASCIPMTGEWIPDRLAGRALAEAQPQGRLVTWFDWGEYAIWHLSPSVRVSLDGRRETVYSDVVLKNHRELAAARPEGLAYLQKLDPDYVWLPASLVPVREWLSTHGYRIDVLTQTSFVAVRAGKPALRLSDAPMPGCFPGP